MEGFMKFEKIAFISLLFLFTLFFTKPMLAHKWEIGLRVMNSDGTARGNVTVKIYQFNNGARNLDEIRSFVTSSSFDTLGAQGVNAAGDIGSSDYGSAYFAPLDVGDYYVRIENNYLILEYDSGAYGDFIIEYQNSVISFSNINSGYGSRGPFTWTDKTISLRNHFGDDYSSVSGKIFLNSEQINTGYTYVNKIREATTFPHNISGEDNQFINNYYRIWKSWDIGDSSISQDLDYVANYQRTAMYKRKLDVTYRNYFNSSDQGGSIKLNDNSQNSPASLTLYDDGSYKLEAVNTTRDNVYYWFDHWEFGGSNISSSNPLNSYEVPSHGTLQSVFNHKPVNTYRYLTFNDDEYGNPVQLTWQKHPLDNNFITQYAIVRKVKHNGVMGSAVQIATISANGSSNYSYTDYDYLITNGYTDDLLYYDVRAFYSPNYSDEDYEAVYGEINPVVFDDRSKINLIKNSELPTEYKINIYPNPFNPETTITYQLPEDEFVTIKVFDILGKEVETLANENKSSGYYKISFSGSQLTSGVYILTLKTNRFLESKKILLTK
jgi:hypothetical protein